MSILQSISLGPSTAPRWETVQNPKGLNSVPDVVQLALSFLLPGELCRASKVCVNWRWAAYHVVEDLNENLKNQEGQDFALKYLSSMHPKLRVIGPAEWARCGLLGVPKPILDLRTAIPEILRLLETVPVEEDAGGTLLTMPEGFDFKALTELMEAFREAHGAEGAAAKFDYILPAADRVLRETPPIQGRVVFMTRNVLPGSRNQHFASQKALVEGHGCEMPDALTAMTLAMVTYMVSQEFLFGRGDIRLTYTRTLDEVVIGSARYRIVVGGFAPAGLDVYNYNPGIDDIGSGALRKF